MVVLLVDDSETIRRMLSHALKEMGVNEVLEAESAERALTMLRFFSMIDLILTDWHMPGMSGLEFITTLRARKQFEHTPIIMTTSESAGENVVAALRAGATNYIIKKPFNHRQLADKIMPYIHAAGMASRSSGNMAAISHSGKLADGELANLIQFLFHTEKTGRCEVEFENTIAYIYFKHGKITGAVYQSEVGEQAFCTCMNLQPKRYRFREETYQVPNGMEISRTNTALLLKAAAQRDELNGTAASPSI